MLPSTAHVKIGDYEYMLEDSSEEPYAQNLESLYSDTQKIIGLEAETANPNVLVWSHDDFAGGSENKYYVEDLPDSYWFGNNNPRVRGSITSPPDRASSTLGMTTSDDEAYFVQTGGRLWLGSGRDLWYSTDGSSWSAWNPGTPFGGVGYSIRGMTHDGYFPIVWMDNGTTVKIRKVTSTTTETAFVGDITNGFRTFGGAMLEGFIYFWTGKQLLKFDSTESLPITYDADTHVVHAPFDPAATGTYNAGIANTENSIVYFTAASGASHVFEYRYAAATDAYVPRPIWQPASGFTATHITSSMGVIYLLGEYGDQIGLMGMSVANREPLFLSYVGQQYGANGTALNARGLAPSYASQVILAMGSSSTNYVFVYDAETDAISQLDEYPLNSSNGTIRAVRTYKEKRVAAGEFGTDLFVRNWKQDFDTPTGAWTWISSAYHLGFPMDEKLLFGFQVVCDPTIVAGTVQIEYQIDESGTWVSAGTTAAGVKYTNLNVATSNVKFRNLRIRATGASGARMFSVTVRSYVNSFQRTWRLVLKLNDEMGINNPTSRLAPAHVLRDNLLTLATTKSSVTFLDGWRYPEPGGNNVADAADGTGYTTHTVVVEFPRYGGVRTRKVQGRFQGSAEVVLRDVTP